MYREERRINSSRGISMGFICALTVSVTFTSLSTAVGIGMLTNSNLYIPGGVYITVQAIQLSFIVLGVYINQHYYIGDNEIPSGTKTIWLILYYITIGIGTFGNLFVSALLSKELHAYWTQNIDPARFGVSYMFTMIAVMLFMGVLYLGYIMFAVHIIELLGTLDVSRFVLYLPSHTRKYEQQMGCTCAYMDPYNIPIA